jgi:hypothetical protein
MLSEHSWSALIDHHMMRFFYPTELSLIAHGLKEEKQKKYVLLVPCVLCSTASAVLRAVP